MKFIAYLIAIAIPSLAFAQDRYLELVQKPLLDRSSISAFEADQLAQRLDESLSFSLQDKVVRKSDAFYISNLSEMKKMIDHTREKQRSNLLFRMSTFNGEPESRISFTSIKQLEGRDILRGEIEGYPGSQVKLVMYEDTLSGRITYPGKQHVIVIQNVDDVSAFYEIDVSDITYD